MARLEIKKYAQVELNNVAFRRDGRIEAQCKLNEDQFAEVPAENGMILMVDKAKNEVIKPNADSYLPYALHYSSEHMYDERANSLKDFALFPGTFLPRMGYLAEGDLFTTNCISIDSGKWEDVKDTLYGIPSTDGSINIVADPGEARLVLKVVKVYTMPNGEPGVKFQVVRA